jgi:hypothetical protein
VVSVLAELLFLAEPTRLSVRDRLHVRVWLVLAPILVMAVGVGRLRGPPVEKLICALTQAPGTPSDYVCSHQPQRYVLQPSPPTHLVLRSVSCLATFGSNG